MESGVKYLHEFLYLHRRIFFLVRISEFRFKKELSYSSGINLIHISWKNSPFELFLYNIPSDLSHIEQLKIILTIINILIIGYILPLFLSDLTSFTNKICYIFYLLFVTTWMNFCPTYRTFDKVLL